MSSTQWGQWCAKPFARRRGMRVLISVSAIGPVVTVGCMAFLAARRWASTDWGTVPAWVSAVGSLATCVSVGIAAVTYLRAQEDRRRAERDRSEDRAAAREDQATQAKLVRLSALARGGLDDEGRQRWKVMLRNDSDRPVFGVRIHTLCAVATEGASAAPMRSRQLIDRGRYWRPHKSIPRISVESSQKGELSVWIHEDDCGRRGCARGSVGCRRPHSCEVSLI